MIVFSNRQRHDDKPFEDYLKLPGYSHSFLKNENNGFSSPITMSDKIKLGSLVDAILTQPNEVDIYSPLLKDAERIAKEIIGKFGSLISGFESQISLTADMTFNGITMPGKFRLDWGVKDIAVIDLKITGASKIAPLIKHMGYDNQLFGYQGAYNVQNGFIMAYSTSKRFCELIHVPTNNGDFWKEKILKFGRVK